jgi:hypothetical protein
MRLQAQHIPTSAPVNSIAHPHSCGEAKLLATAAHLHTQLAMRMYLVMRAGPSTVGILMCKQAPYPSVLAFCLNIDLQRPLQRLVVQVETVPSA